MLCLYNHFYIILVYHIRNFKIVVNVVGTQRGHNICINTRKTYTLQTK